MLRSKFKRYNNPELWLFELQNNYDLHVGLKVTTNLIDDVAPTF
jgi:hypothetical protein